MVRISGLFHPNIPHLELGEIYNPFTKDAFTNFLGHRSNPRQTAETNMSNSSNSSNHTGGRGLLGWVVWTGLPFFNMKWWIPFEHSNATIDFWMFLLLMIDDRWVGYQLTIEIYDFSR